MSRRSGKYAYVNGIPCTQGWSSSRSSSLARYFASCVPGASGASGGNIDETGNVNGVGYLPPFPTGEDFEFVGVASSLLGQIMNYVGNVQFTECSINIPVASGGPITWTAGWGAQGELVKETSTQYEDEVGTPTPSSRYGRISIEGTPDSDTFTFVDRVQSITMSFRRPASTSVNDGSMEREAGNLEADLSFEVHNDDRDLALYELNGINRVRVYVTETEFFLFDSIIWQAHSNYQVNRGQNPPPIIGYTVNGMWTALRDQNPPALGQIILPDSTVLYPEEGGSS